MFEGVNDGTVVIVKKRPDHFFNIIRVEEVP
jgi:hypothetical protein